MSRGRNATLFSSYEPWTDTERAKVREMNLAFYDTFVSKAAEGRKKTPAEIEAVAQGRVWTGREALEGGLVDALGGLDVAVRLARERARIPAGQDVQLVVLPESKGFFDTLMERQEEDVSVRVLGREARVARALATACARSGGPIARAAVRARGPLASRRAAAAGAPPPAAASAAKSRP